MATFFTLFLSNRAERLYQSLKAPLFSFGRPFAKRLIIVPSAAMKSWLMQQMVQDPCQKICAGVEMGYVEPTLKRLHALLGKQDKAHESAESYEPTESELAFAIEATLHGVIKSYDFTSLAEKKTWNPLFDYLGINGQGSPAVSKLPRKTAQRISALAATLAQLFVAYGKYGGEWLVNWRPNGEVDSDWQRLLWDKLEERFSLWNYPYRQYSSVEINDAFAPEELQVHLFGLSYLAPLHHRFLLKIAEKIPVYYYILSPCQKFWSDLLSDKEGVRLLKYWQQKKTVLPQQEILEDYLRDNNPLLANFGRLGREMALQLEMSDLRIEENYALPESLFSTDVYPQLVGPDLHKEPSPSTFSLLEAIQSDMVLLRNPETTPKLIFNANDDSLQIHAAPKPMREVEAIYHTLMDIIGKHAHDSNPITPADVIVMASNLSTYEPYIRAVFESPESRLPINLMEVQKPAQNRLIQAFLYLIELPWGRWEAQSLLQLLDYTAFQKRQEFTPEGVLQLQRWIKMADIRWGKDSEHRHELLKRDHCSKEMVDTPRGTWEHGLGQLLDSLAMPTAPFSEEVSSMNGLDAIQGDLLGAFLGLLRSLHADLKPLIDQTQLTLKEWSDYLKCLYEVYFRSVSDEEIEGEHELLKQLSLLGKAGTRLSEEPFAFHSIKRHLEAALNTCKTGYRESNLQAVRFCSLLPMRAVPAKVVILMGMGDGEFPRRDSTLSLNLLLEGKGDYCPTQTDFDRYLFLEALLSARRYFIISYVSQKAGESQPQPPSLLVTELLAYIDKAYQLPQGSLQCCRTHPLNPFHHSYFSGEGPLKSYFHSRYLEALVHYSPHKKKAHTFLSAFAPPSPQVSKASEEVHVALSELMAFARSPLKVYLNKCLELYLDKREERQLKHEEEMLLSKLDDFRCLKDSLQLSFSTLQDRIPQGPFHHLESERLSTEIEALKGILRSHGVNLEKMMSLEFNERYTYPKATEDGWKLPPLRVSHVLISGLIDNVTSAGLIVVHKDGVKDQVKVWPMGLVFSCLVRQHNLPVEPVLIFGRGGKKMPSIENPEVLLGRFLEYYFEGLRHPSPLLPDWVPDLMEGSLESTYSEEESEFRPIYDEYLKWFKKSSPGIDLTVGREHWQGLVQQLFNKIT